MRPRLLAGFVGYNRTQSTYPAVDQIQVITTIIMF